VVVVVTIRSVVVVTTGWLALGAPGTVDARVAELPCDALAMTPRTRIATVAGAVI
jgi:hypothetical protein